MKKFLVLVLVGIMLLACNEALASGGTSYTANSSPVIVMLTASSASKEVTFPYTTRNLYIRNYDTAGGMWVNLNGGDINAAVTNAGVNMQDRLYIGPSGSMDILDFATNRVTILNDVYFTSNQIASPIVVLATY